MRTRIAVARGLREKPRFARMIREEGERLRKAFPCLA
jgi:hypothetical protein